MSDGQATTGGMHAVPFPAGARTAPLDMRGECGERERERERER